MNRSDLLNNINIMLRGKRIARLAALCLSCVTCIAHADVYVSYAADGSARYATQPYDASYVLLLKDERTTSPPVHQAAAVESASLRKRREALEPVINTIARKHQLEPALVRAIAHVESGFHTGAVSPKGATGAMQLMPGTAARYGAADRKNPAQNIEAGARYFKDLLALFDNNIALALAAYNSGEGAVARHAKKIPPYRETMLYVPEVLARYEAYRRADAAR